MTYDDTALNEALSRDDEARATFTWMAQSHRAAFSGWVTSAKSQRERQMRVRAAIDMLAGRDVIRRN